MVAASSRTRVPVDLLILWPAVRQGLVTEGRMSQRGRQSSTCFGKPGPHAGPAPPAHFGELLGQGITLKRKWLILGPKARSRTLGRPLNVMAAGAKQRWGASPAVIRVPQLHQASCFCLEQKAPVAGGANLAVAPCKFQRSRHELTPGDWKTAQPGPCFRPPRGATRGSDLVCSAKTATAALWCLERPGEAF